MYPAAARLRLTKKLRYLNLADIHSMREITFPLSLIHISLANPSQGLHNIWSLASKGLASGSILRVKKALNERYLPPAGVSQSSAQIPADFIKPGMMGADSGESRKTPQILEKAGWTSGFRCV